MKRFYLILIGIYCLMSCSNELHVDSGIKANLSEEEMMGEWHNSYLDSVFDFIKTNPIMLQGSRSGFVTIDDYAKCLASVQVAVLKDSKRIKSMSSSQRWNYIENSLNVTLSERTMNSIRSLLSDSDYSLTEDLKDEFSDEVSETIEGYLDEIIEVFMSPRYNVSNAGMENRINLIHLKWYKLATDEDKEIISSTTNVALSSLDYWQDNATQWKASLKGNALRTFIIGTAVADLASVARIVYIGRQYSIIFWKEIAAAAAACSAYAAVESAIVGVIDWVISANGNYVVKTENDKEQMEMEEFQNLVKTYSFEMLNNEQD